MSDPLNDVREIRQRKEEARRLAEREVEMLAGRVHEPLEPTDGEQRNGWSEPALSAYVASRRARHTSGLDFQSRPQPKPSVANSRYQPKRWRG